MSARHVTRQWELLGDKALRSLVASFPYKCLAFPDDRVNELAHEAVAALAGPEETNALLEEGKGDDSPVTEAEFARCDDDDSGDPDEDVGEEWGSERVAARKPQ